MSHKKKKYDLIEELFVPSPSGIKKLIAAWSHLSFIDKLMVLDAIEQNSYPNYLHQELYEHVLLDDNPYLRYIAAIHSIQ